MDLDDLRYPCMHFSFSSEMCTNTQCCYANRYLLSNSDIWVGKVGSQNVLIKKKKENHKINFIYNFGDTVV